MNSATATKIFLMGFLSRSAPSATGFGALLARSAVLSGHLTTKPLDRQAREAGFAVAASETDRRIPKRAGCQSVVRRRSRRLAGAVASQAIDRWQIRRHRLRAAIDRRARRGAGAVNDDIGAVIHSPAGIAGRLSSGRMHAGERSHRGFLVATPSLRSRARRSGAARVGIAGRCSCGGPYLILPGPQSALPGFAPVCSPSLST
jgi:hypothetical protein